MRFKLPLLLLSLLLVPTAFADECQVRHISKLSETDTRQEYPIALLNLLLEATEEKYGKCESVAIGVANQRRQIAWLKEGKNLDVAWLPVSNVVNSQLLPLPVPIRKGFLGWRVLLVHKDTLESIKQVTSLKELNQFSTGFGATWGDLPVMQHNFSNVITTVTYDSLFEMLLRKRFDFLSRAAYEAFDEINARNEDMPQLVVVPNIALHYKEADFFYVNPKNQLLFNRLQEGLKKTLRDGSFNVLFYGYYADVIDRINMRDRTVIHLDNPFLPKNVPVETPELWFQLDVYDKLKQQIAQKKLTINAD